MPPYKEVKLEPVVGFALHHCCVPTPTNSKQINRLRWFPSKIRLPEDFKKIKNYPANSVSKFSHYSSSIILLELLLEVSFRFHNHWLHVVVFYSLDVALF
jgi:hypothetical protein